jgi:O-succinylbenzoic acid--CoA ligase
LHADGYRDGVTKLVALLMEPGPEFVRTLSEVWERGDVATPVDVRLPPSAREALLDHLAPAAVVDAEGSTTERPGGRDMEPGDALVVATSGSTGVPKAVVLTHDALTAAAVATSEFLGVDPASDRWLSCLPLAHVGGLGVVARALITGTPLEVHPGFDPVAVEQAARSGATLVSLVPTTLARTNASLFRRILVGGQAPPARRPAHVVATYGLTETGGGVVYDGHPLNGVELRADAVGVIEVRGPMLLRCYLGGYDPKDADGWLSTGDLGEVSADGVLQVFGRQGDLIITGGENVWPGPVERILEGHPAIADVAVVGRASAEWGHEVTAIVVLDANHEAPGLDELRGLVRETLPAYCAPKAVEIVDSLPRTALGKLKRYDLH